VVETTKMSMTDRNGRLGVCKSPYLSRYGNEALAGTDPFHSQPPTCFPVGCLPSKMTLAQRGGCERGTLVRLK